MSVWTHPNIVQLLMYLETHKRKKKKKKDNLGVAIGHLVDEAAGGESPARRRGRSIGNGIDGDIDDNPNAFSVLLTEAEEA